MSANKTSPHRPGKLLLIFTLGTAAMLGFVMLNSYGSGGLWPTPNTDNPQQQPRQDTTTPTADPYQPGGYQYDDSAYKRQQQQMQEAAHQFEEDHWAWEEEQTRQQYIEEQNSH